MEIDWILWMTDRVEGGLLKGTTVVHSLLLITVISAERRLNGYGI